MSVGPLTGTASAAATQLTPPRITHNAWLGETLHLTPGTYSDAMTVVDNWVMCSDSAGSTCSLPTTDMSDTYLIGNGDVGSYIKVTETVTGTDSSVTPFDSNVTFKVQAAAPNLQVAPRILDTTSGSTTISQGDTLSVVDGTWSEPPDSFTYQWKDCDSSGTVCGAPVGAASTYVTGPSDVGHTIQLQETPVYGPTAPATATGTALIGAPANSPSDPPKISGTAQQGEMLTVSPGTWSPSATSYNYQWQDCNSVGQACTPIQGATAPTYTLVDADVGDTVDVSVSGVNAAGTASAATSAPTNIVQTSSTVSFTAAPGSAVTNQAVTLAATVTSKAAAGAPSGSVAFTDTGEPISGCSAVPVAPAGQSVTVLCQTSFGAGTAQLAATFTPAAASTVLGSSTPTQTLGVARDTPTTNLDATAQVEVNSTTTYTATVAPNAARSGPIQPAGDVEFLDGGQPIQGCSSQRLVSGGATCAIKYSAAGSRSITARYLGDTNFVGSSSASEPVRVTALPTKGMVTATMQWTFAFAPAYTRVLNMVINGVPTGASVQITCHGRGCPYAKRSTTIGKPKPCTGKAKRTHTCPIHGRISLKGTFQRRQLRPGAQITIEIRRPRYVGKYYRFTMLSRKQPRVQIGCVAIGSNRPNVGC